MLSRRPLRRSARILESVEFGRRPPPATEKDPGASYVKLSHVPIFIYMRPPRSSSWVGQGRRHTFPTIFVSFTTRQAAAQHDGPFCCQMFGGGCYSRRRGIGIFCGTLLSGGPGTTITTHDDSERAGGEGVIGAHVATGCYRGRFWSRGCVFVRLRRCSGRQGRPGSKGHQGGSRVRNLPQRLHLLLHKVEGAVAVKARVHPGVPPNMRQDESPGNDRGAPHVKKTRTVEIYKNRYSKGTLT